MTLLYLDDDPDDIGFFTQAAESISGIEKTFTTNDPLRFFSVLTENDPGRIMIFLDINMPESGFEVLKKIRARKDCEKVPVIMLSTSSDHASISRSKQLGATHYSVKPDSINKLRLVIERALAVLNEPSNNASFVISG